ncbi:MAG TPA: Ig-like domain-containing protein, partial [Acidimicrobiia bacterium]
STSTPGAIPYGPANGSFAVDSHTGEYVDTFPTGLLEYTISAGPWAAHGAPDGCLWLGGDMNLDAIGNAFTNSLIKHCPEAGAGSAAGPPLTAPNWDTSTPTAPGALNVAVTGTNQVSLTWPAGSDNDVVEYYRVYRDGALLSAANFTNLSYTERVPGTHTYAVTSVDRRLNESAQRSSGPVVVPGPAGDYAHLALGGDFDFSTDGFTYVDDAFEGTSNPQYANGFWVADGTFSDAGLAVHIAAAVQNQTINGISGGFSRSFTLAQSTDVTVSLVHRLEVGTGFTSSDCAEVRLAVDGVPYGQGGNSYLSRICDGGLLPYAQSTIRIGTLAPGTHTLRIGAYVNRKGFAYSGNAAQATFDDVFIVGSAPGAAVTSPAAGSPLTGTQTVAVAATDFADSAGSLAVQVSADNGATWNDASWNAAASRHQWTWNTASSGNGSRTLLARATDSHGLTTISAPVEVTIGNGAPTVAVTAPSAGSLVTGTTTIQVQASDDVDPAGSLDVEVSVDSGASWNVAAWNPALSRYQWSWNSAAGPDGPRTIQARATDSNGNTTGSAVVGVTVDNTVPGYAEAVAADGPTVWWRLGEASGTVADDNVGSLNGTYVGGPTLGAAGLIAHDS